MSILGIAFIMPMLGAEAWRVGRVRVSRMTPVGHSLMGITIAALCLPSKLSKTMGCLGFASFVVLANLPDAPLPGWGHDRYHVSHSVFVNATLIACLLLAGWMWRPERVQYVPWRVLTGGIVAWFSHFLLDTFYNHGRGLAMFWPISEARLALPVPWFRTVDSISPSLTPHNIMVGVVELLAYGILLGIALVWRRHQRRSSQPWVKPSR